MMEMFGSMCIYTSFIAQGQHNRTSLIKTMENMIEISVCLGIDDAQSNVVETLAWRLLWDQAGK